MAIEKSRYFLAFYVANSGTGHVTGCASIETFGIKTFLSRIQAEEHVKNLFLMLGVLCLLASKGLQKKSSSIGTAIKTKQNENFRLSKIRD